MTINTVDLKFLFSIVPNRSLLSIFERHFANHIVTFLDEWLLVTTGHVDILVLRWTQSDIHFIPRIRTIKERAPLYQQQQDSGDILWQWVTSGDRGMTFCDIATWQHLCHDNLWRQSANSHRSPALSRSPRHVRVGRAIFSHNSSWLRSEPIKYLSLSFISGKTQILPGRAVTRHDNIKSCQFPVNFASISYQSIKYLWTWFKTEIIMFSENLLFLLKVLERSIQSSIKAIASVH